MATLYYMGQATLYYWIPAFSFRRNLNKCRQKATAKFAISIRLFSLLANHCSCLYEIVYCRRLLKFVRTINLRLESSKSDTQFT